MVDTPDLSQGATPNLVHLLGHYVVPGPGYGISSLREMNEEEFRAFRSAITTVRTFLNRRSYGLARETISTYVQIHRDHESRIGTSLGEMRTVGKEATYDLLTRLALTLEATRLFLNHTETGLKRQYGEDSDEWRAWQRSKSARFDQSFAYRFLYNLRNYLHKDLPPAGITLDCREVVPGETVSTMSVVLSPYKLLATYDRWHPMVRADLDGMTEVFAVLPLVEELGEHLGALMIEAMTADLPAALDAVTLLQGLADEVAKSGGVPIVFSITPTETDSRRIQVSEIPVESLPLIRAAAQGRFTVLGR